MSIGEDVESFETQAEAWDFDVLNSSHHHVCVPGRRGRRGEGEAWERSANPLTSV